MYRAATNNRDRAVTISAVVLIHAAIGYALLNASTTVAPGEKQPDLQLIDLSSPVPPPPPPPPPPVEEVQKPEQARPREQAAPAAPKNIESVATPVVAPKPRVIIPAPTPVIAATAPNTGASSTQGASDVPGPGTGAGGAGTGTGSGGAGTGAGGGGAGGSGLGGGQPSGATIIQSTSLTLADYPRDVRRAWPRGGRVYVAVRVQLDGRATDCKVNRSIGIPQLDQWTCRLVEQKVRFRPAIDERGQPYVAWYGYVQYWTGA